MAAFVVRGLLARPSWKSPARQCQWSACHHLSQKRLFHRSALYSAIKPYLLADIGEGITECRVIGWSVKPGDRVGQFDPICEVQSDKATVEITSRYDGVITAVHHQVDETAIVGKPLVDIDVEDEGAPNGPEPETTTSPPESGQPSSTQSQLNPQEKTPYTVSDSPNGGLMTPAVRRIVMENKLDLSQIDPTGKGGRVLKEDVQRYLASKTMIRQQSPQSPPSTTRELETSDGDETKRLSPHEMAMYSTMTKALTIPHFGYSHFVDLTTVKKLCRNINDPMLQKSALYGSSTTKLTPLSIIAKAISQAFNRHPNLNSHFNANFDPQNPEWIMKKSHDFGIAMDTPRGLVVPVVRGVQNHSVLSLAEEIKRLSNLAQEGRLAPSDLQGASFIVSNIGSIGGHVVSPVIVPPMVAIVGIGRVEHVPVFVDGPDGQERLIKREKAVLSWSADHRVIDGAAVANCADFVRKAVEDIDGMVLGLR